MTVASSIPPQLVPAAGSKHGIWLWVGVEDVATTPPREELAALADSLCKAACEALPGAHAVAAVADATTEALEARDSPRVVIDLATSEVRLRGAPVHLTSKEFGLLALLARFAGTIITREVLYQVVWGDAAIATSSRTLDVHIRRVRQKLGLHTQIVTVRARGFLFHASSDLLLHGADDGKPREARPAAPVASAPAPV